MTDKQMELYNKTMVRLRRIGAKTPTEQIVALAEEIDRYRDKIRRMEEALEMSENIKHLLEQDIADRDKMLESKVEEVYADFMQDYKAMREELEGACEECNELRKAVKKQTPLKPHETDDYPHRFYCTECYFTLAFGKENIDFIKSNQMYNYCPACGQAIDWSEEGAKSGN